MGNIAIYLSVTEKCEVFGKILQNVSYRLRKFFPNML